MTFSFIQAIERGHGITYGSILNAIRSFIRSSDSDLGSNIVTSLLTMLITRGSDGFGMRQVNKNTFIVIELFFRCKGALSKLIDR